MVVCGTLALCPQAGMGISTFLHVVGRLHSVEHSGVHCMFTYTDQGLCCYDTSNYASHVPSPRIRLADLQSLV